MNLLENNMEDFVLVNRLKIPDGQAGYNFSFADDKTFKACARLDDSSETDSARVKKIRNIYTVTVSRAVRLYAKNIIRRLSDGKMFLVISDGTDNKTPKGAGLDMRQVRAEEYFPPDNRRRL